MNETYLYPYSASDARERGEIELWRESAKANIACKDAIEKAIKDCFDGMYLSECCAQSVIAEYGYKRTAFVLANTLQEKAYDGRFSSTNKAWGAQTYVPKDEMNYRFTVDSHPAVLDGFMNQ